MLFGREPALVLGLVLAVMQLAVGFGVELSTEQQGLIMAAATAVVSIAIRQSVTPVTGR